MQDIFLLLLPFTNALVAPFMFFPFITLKALSLRVLTALFLIFGVKEFNINFKDKIFISTLLFLISSLLSTIFSLTPYRSFWGNAERMDGFLSLFIYFILFLVLREIFLTDKEKIVIYLNSFIIFGIVATLGVLPKWLSDISLRPEGIMGNGAYMGIVGMCTFFLSLILLELNFKAKNEFQKVLAYLGIIFGFLLLIIAQTRSAFLGFIAGIFIYGLLKLPTKGKIILTLLILIVFLLLGTLNPQSLPLPILSRVSEILHGQITGSALTRLTVWKMFLQTLKEKPFFGYGLELSPYIFGKYFNPHLFEIEKAIFDRAHNKYVELLATQGIFGLVTYLFIYLAVFYLLAKLYRQKEFVPSVASFFIAFAVNNFFIFDIQYTWMLFFGLLAWLSSFEADNLKKIKFLFLRQVLGVALILICLLNFWQIRLVVENLRANSIDKFFNDLQKVGPYRTEMIVHLAPRLANQVLNDNLKISKYYGNILNTYLGEPTDLRLASLYFTFSTQVYPFLIEEEKKEVEKRIENFIQQFPLWPTAILTSINYYLNIKNEPLKTLEILDKIKKYPAYQEYQVTVAYELYKKGFPSQAYELMKELEEKNYQFNEKEKIFYDELKNSFSTLTTPTPK